MKKIISLTVSLIFLSAFPALADNILTLSVKESRINTDGTAYILYQPTDAVIQNMYATGKTVPLVTDLVTTAAQNEASAAAEMLSVINTHQTQQYALDPKYIQ